MKELLQESQETESPFFPLDVTTTTKSEEKGKQEKQAKKTMLPKTNSLSQQFNDFLVEAIDEALTSLGEPVKNTIYQHLADDFKIAKKCIPEHIEEFSRIMHKTFGLSATRLEMKFMKNLNNRINADVKWKEYDWPVSKWIVMEMSFVDYIKNVRQAFENQTLKKSV